MKIVLDYKGFFGNKRTASPYRSGFNLNLLESAFKKCGLDITYVNFASLSKETIDESDVFLLTGSEDFGYLYKSYIEDLAFYLNTLGNKIIPNINLIRATNNKVYMELYGRKKIPAKYRLNSYVFGTLEELRDSINIYNLNYPIVVKGSSGSQSSNVKLAENSKVLIKQVKKISRSRSYLSELKDRLRVLKYPKYTRDSLFRKKFILQDFIGDLEYDYKVRAFYPNKYYVVKRLVRSNDFRASGSGKFEYFNSIEEIPANLLNAAKEIFHSFDTPFLSLDLVIKGNEVYLIEYQAHHFGTMGVVYSDYYFIFDEESWKHVKDSASIEEVYADSVVSYLGR